MPPLPGEERLVTLFADVHYYFAKPAVRPLRHRFDKASYFYVYYNATRQTSRIEIANNPGTEYQDAFNGYLDKCRITNSFKFPTLMTLEVDAEGISASPTSPISRDPDEWRLDSADLRETRREKHKLHTLDIYFWTVEDARLALGFLNKLLEPSQLDIAEQSLPANNARGTENVSPVVQNLENVAISDPAFRNGQTRNSQNQPQTKPVNLPPPPPPPAQQSQTSRTTTSAQSQSSLASSRDHTMTPGSQTSETSFAPMAYNPAAPPAPEPRAHREKTPPPEDVSDGHGLISAATHEDGYRPGYSSPQSTMGRSRVQGPPQGHYGSPPPPPPMASTLSHGPPSAAGYASPPPPQQQQQQYGVRSSSVAAAAPSFAPPPTSVAPGYGSPQSSAGYGVQPSQQQRQQQPANSSLVVSTQPFAPPPTGASPGQDPHRHSVAAMHYVPDSTSYEHTHPVETPGAQFYSTIPHEKRPLQHIQPRYPEYFPDHAANANNSQSQLQQQQYAPHQQYHHHQQQQQQQQQTSSGGNEYSVHHQIYNPDLDNQSQSQQQQQQHRKSSSRIDSTRPSSQQQTSSSSPSSTLSKLKGFGRTLTKDVDRKVAGYIDKSEKKQYL